MKFDLIDGFKDKFIIRNEKEYFCDRAKHKSDPMEVSTIKKAWQMFIDECNDPVRLYMHIPYCKTICTFCKYNSNTKYTPEALRVYFYTYFMPLFESFKDIVAQLDLDEFYLGGGTPDLVPLPMLQELFDTIPNFSKIPRKVLDGHAVFCTEERVKFYGENGFTYINFGTQTFDNEYMKRFNRVENDVPDLLKSIKMCKKYGMWTSIDLVYGYNFDFSTETNPAELDRFMRDFKIAMHLDPDVINCNFNFKVCRCDKCYSNAFAEFINRVQEECDKYGLYYHVDPAEPGTHVVKRESPIQQLSGRYIAFGDKNNATKPSSFISDSFQYHEENIKNKPHFFGINKLF